MPKIYVEGFGGLGNSLFQIAVAINFAEKYNYEIILVHSKYLDYGDSLRFKRSECQQKDINGNIVSYQNNIFSKFKWVDSLEDTFKKSLDRFSGAKLRRNKYKRCKNDILMWGYCQVPSLYTHNLNFLNKYLDLDNKEILSYIYTKYPNIENSVCIGCRCGRDFRYRKRHIKKESYLNALKKVNELNISYENNLIILSDVSTAWDKKYDMMKDYPAQVASEIDVIELIMGALCKVLILSEGTFHLWMSYIGKNINPNQKVIYFEKGETTSRKLMLSDWIKVSNE